MKSGLTRHDWEEYLIRLYFGNKSDLIILCINRAYRDLNRTLHGIDDHEGKHGLFNLTVQPQIDNAPCTLFKGDV